MSLPAGLPSRAHVPGRRRALRPKRVRKHLILLYDEGISALTPAPGFPQTLPGGPLWRAFLKQRPDAGATFTLQLPFPDQDTLRSAQCFACGSVVFLLIGGASNLPVDRLAEAPLLPALLEAEAAQLASSGLVGAAREATERATSLAGALDHARAEVGRKAVALSAALSEADRLNRELSKLNQTLEQRVADEIEERMQVEETLRQAQKMEAIGQLTGGVAHDFNNLLTVIMGSLDSIRRQLDNPANELDISRLRRLQSMAFQGAERASTLTSRLLAFARRQPLNPEPVDLNRLVAGLTDLLQRTLGERIALETVSTRASGWPRRTGQNSKVRSSTLQSMRVMPSRRRQAHCRDSECLARRGVCQGPD